MNKLSVKVLLLVLALTTNVVAQSGVTVTPPSSDNICLLSSLDISKITCLSGEKVYADASTNNNPITIRGTVYTSGVGTHAPSRIVVKVNGATRFKTFVGIDDECYVDAGLDNHGVADYVVTAYRPDNKTGEVVARGNITMKDAAPAEIDIDVTGWDYLVLDADEGTQPWADHVDWANAYFEYLGTKPAIISENEMYLDESNIITLPQSGLNGEEIIPLSSLEIGKATCGWGTIKADQSIDGNAITLKGKVYSSGVGTHASSQIIVKLNGAVTRFATYVGIDDEVLDEARTNSSYGVCDYRVTLKAENGETQLVDEGTIRATDTAIPFIEVDCVGWKYLILEAFDGEGGDACDHVDWANAYFEYLYQNSTPPVIVSLDEISSKLACANVLFSQPGVRYMHKVRAANSDAELSVENLPNGLVWNEKRSLVEGVIYTEGEYEYIVNVTLDGETVKEPIKLTVSQNLQQPVPFMGWLSWNVVQGDISDEVVRTVADAMLSTGLADAGYRYLCIDDLWHASQREVGTDKPKYDEAKFPYGMKAVSDYVHSKGLKFGIYSDGGSMTCAGCFGSYGYEDIDAQQYADWGVDMLKYDYCYAPSDLESCRARYKTMGDALKATGRNILFYMCEWGVREPWKWGHETGASCWRCTYDRRDGWNGINGGVGIVQSIAGMKDLWAYSGVNRFNDADMMCVGIHGTGKSSNDLVAGTPGMTQTEYRTEFSLWCMWSSPLSLTFDLRKPISDEDLEIMTNEEMIALNQDRMGQQAEFIGEYDGVQVYAKDLENGDVAIAVLNLNGTSRNFTVDFSTIPALDADYAYMMRDLWEKTNVGEFKDEYSLSVASHETKVYRMSKVIGDTGVKLIDEVYAVVETDGNILKIVLPHTAGANKRILVSDLKGRVVAESSGVDEEFCFYGLDKNDVYIVTAVCNCKSQNYKIIF